MYKMQNVNVCHSKLYLSKIFLQRIRSKKFKQRMKAKSIILRYVKTNKILGTFSLFSKKY